jgi:magnesium-transporting ATPase (P-type)
MSYAHNPEQPWHFWDSDRVIAQLETTADGLTYAIARKRLREIGRNIFPREPSFWTVLGQGWQNLVLWIGMGTAVLLQWLGESSWMVVVGLVLHTLINVCSQFWLIRLQQRATLTRWQKVIPDPTTLVYRDQEWMSVSSRLLVPGDLVGIQAGNTPAVDVRLLEASDDLCANEVVLGGGAIVPKQANQSLDLHTAVTARSNLIYAGSQIITGSGVGLVVATGLDTHWQSLKQSPPWLMHWKQKLTDPQLLAIVVVSLVAGIIAFPKGTAYSLHLVVVIWLAGYSCPKDLWTELVKALGVGWLARQRILVRHSGTISRLAIMDGLETMPLDLQLKEDDRLYSQLEVVRMRPDRADPEKVLPFPKPYQEVATPEPQLSAEVISLFPQTDLVDAPDLFDPAGNELDVSTYWQEEAEINLPPQHIAIYAQKLDYLTHLQNAWLSLTDRSGDLPMQQTAQVVLPRPDLQYLCRAIVHSITYQDRADRLGVLVLSGLSSLLMLVGIASLGGLTLIPMHILWLGAIVLPLLGITLLTEPNGETPPPQLVGGQLPYVVATSAMVASTLSLFLLKYQGQIPALTTARTMAFTALVFAQVFHAIALSRSSLVKHWLLSAIVVVLMLCQILLVQVEPISAVFETVPLAPAEWLIVVFASTSVLWVQEIMRST